MQFLFVDVGDGDGDRLGLASGFGLGAPRGVAVEVGRAGGDDDPVGDVTVALPSGPAGVVEPRGPLFAPDGDDEPRAGVVGGGPPTVFPPAPWAPAALGSTGVDGAAATPADPAAPGCGGDEIGIAGSSTKRVMSPADTTRVAMMIAIFSRLVRRGIASLRQEKS